MTKKLSGWNAAKAHILESLDFSGYDKAPKNDAEKLLMFDTIFQSEYGHMIERLGYRKALIEYLQGLPSCCTIAFYNYDILEKAEAWGLIDEAASEARQDAFLDSWWINIASLLADMVRDEKTLSKEELIEALNTLRLARCESTQAMNKASYGAKVQAVFDKLERLES